jgi:hypothetical protein
MWRVVFNLVILMNFVFSWAAEGSASISSESKKNEEMYVDLSKIFMQDNHIYVDTGNGLVVASAIYSDDKDIILNRVNGPCLLNAKDVADTTTVGILSVNIAEPSGRTNRKSL